MGRGCMGCASNEVHLAARDINLDDVLSSEAPQAILAE